MRLPAKLTMAVKYLLWNNFYFVANIAAQATTIDHVYSPSNLLDRIFGVRVKTLALGQRKHQLTTYIKTVST
jgi:hypothetical protein